MLGAVGALCAEHPELGTDPWIWLDYMCALAFARTRTTRTHTHARSRTRTTRTLSPPPSGSSLPAFCSKQSAVNGLATPQCMGVAPTLRAWSSLLPIRIALLIRES
eukprot:4711530-Pleurochrysis_carterae.AAC.1